MTLTPCNVRQSATSINRDRGPPGLVYTDEVLPVSADEAVRLVHASMKRLHGHAIATADAVTTGWVGNVLTNIPGRGEYELIAAVSEAGEEQTLVRCAAPPRFPYALGLRAGSGDPVLSCRGRRGTGAQITPRSAG